MSKKSTLTENPYDSFTTESSKPTTPSTHEQVIDSKKQDMN